MGLFRKKVIEERASEPEDVLLKAFLGSTEMTKSECLNIPSVQSCINFAADTVAMLPIKLYTENNGAVQEVKGDIRTKLLNDDTGDTLDAVQFWRAMVTDYYLGKGGYAYIRKTKNKIVSLHYVSEDQITIQKNFDPIYKDYDIQVNGTTYKPFEFIKILRNTKDGASGQSIINENQLVLSVAYNTMVYEEMLVKKGGNKKGFLKAQKKVSDPTLETIRNSWKDLYSNNSENVIVLNEGLEFQEASSTSVEMQLNENKKTNAIEICKLFPFPVNIIEGNATEKEYNNAFKLGIMPLLKAIECALNRDFLLEKEKGSFYFAFDTKELTKGDIKTRYEAYKIGIDANFLQPDEVRYMEDWEPLGLDFIKLGLDSVLYNPKTKEIYTPNTNQKQNIDDLKGGDNEDESRN